MIEPIYNADIGKKAHTELISFMWRERDVLLEELYLAFKQMP